MAVSDAGVGVIMLKSAIQGSKLNVLINLKMMKNKELKTEIMKKLNNIETEGLKLADQVYRYVEEQLCS